MLWITRDIWKLRKRPSECRSCPWARSSTAALVSPPVGLFAGRTCSALWNGCSRMLGVTQLLKLSVAAGIPWEESTIQISVSKEMEEREVNGVEVQIRHCQNRLQWLHGPLHDNNKRSEYVSGIQWKVSLKNTHVSKSTVHQQTHAMGFKDNPLWNEIVPKGFQNFKVTVTSMQKDCVQWKDYLK